MALSVSEIAVPADAAAQTADPAFVDIDLTPNELGLWVTTDDGVVRAWGVGTPHYGDRPDLAAGERVVSLAPTGGAGYWLFTNRGNVFAFGDAVHRGDVGHLTLAADVIAAVTTPSGEGYYMLGEDGGIFTFGDAEFRGSLPGLGVVPNEPVVSMSATDGGYLLIAADGGTFAFGTAEFYGSLPGIGVAPAAPIVDLVPGPAGYLMLGADGGIFNFGQSNFHGSAAGVLATGDTAVSVTVKADLSGYVVLTASGREVPFGDARGVAPIDLWVGDTETVVDFSNAITSGAALLQVITLDDGFWSVRGLGSDNSTTWFGPSGVGATRGYYLINETSDIVRLELDFGDSYAIALLPLSHARTWQWYSGGIAGTEADVIVTPSVGAGVATTTVVSDGFNVVERYVTDWSFRDDTLFAEIGSTTVVEPLTPSSFRSYIVVDVDFGDSWAISFG